MRARRKNQMILEKRNKLIQKETQRFLRMLQVQIRSPNSEKILSTQQNYQHLYQHISQHLKDYLETHDFEEEAIREYLDLESQKIGFVIKNELNPEILDSFPSSINPVTTNEQEILHTNHSTSNNSLNVDNKLNHSQISTTNGISHEFINSDKISPNLAAIKQKEFSTLETKIINQNEPYIDTLDQLCQLNSNPDLLNKQHQFIFLSKQPFLYNFLNKIHQPNIKNFKLIFWFYLILIRKLRHVFNIPQKKFLKKYLNINQNQNPHGLRKSISE